MNDSAHGRKELIREAVTMALYISLSLLAVLVALPHREDLSGLEAAVTLLLTAVGLVLAHYVAFRLSSRLVDKGVLTLESARALGAQLAGAVPVAIVAALPLLILGGADGKVFSELLLIGFVAGVGYVAVRQTTTRGRALLYVALLVVIIAIVVAVKTAVGH